MKVFAALPLGPPTGSMRTMAFTSSAPGTAFNNVAANLFVNCRNTTGILKPDLRQEVEWRMAHARQCRAGSHKRLRDGFRWPGGWVDHRYFGPFVEHGLRSTQHPMLRLFVASTPRACKNLRAGNSKARLLAIGSKLVLLDHAYVSFNPDMRRVIRVDLDQTFDSWEALRRAIQDAGAIAQPGGSRSQNRRSRGAPHAYWLFRASLLHQERPSPPTADAPRHRTWFSRSPLSDRC